MDLLVMVLACLFLAFAVLGRAINKCIVNPITVFCGLWGVILILYSLPTYDMYPASDESLLLIISGTAMFFVGSMIASMLNFKSSYEFSTSNLVQSNDRSINYNILFILNVFVFLFLIGFGIKVIGMILSGRTFSYIHRMYNVVDEEGILGASSRNKSIVAWFVWPIMHASLSALAVLLQCDDKNTAVLKKWCIIFIFVNLGLFTLISGKRSFMVEFIVFFVAVFFMRGKRVRLKRKTKIAIVIVLIILIWAFDYISAGRGAASITRTFYAYLVGCVPHLSIKLQNTPVDVVGFTSIYGFFHAPITLINAVIKSELLSSIRDSMSQLVAYTQERVSIGTGMSFNAFLTPFYYFYLDGGWIGNIILSFLFGAISTHVYQNFLRKKSLKSMSIYLLVFFSLYMSMVRFQYFQMRFVLSFFYILIIFSDIRVRFILNKRKLHH